MIKNGLKFGAFYDLNKYLSQAFEIQQPTVKLIAIVGETCSIETRDGRAFSIDTKLMIENAKETHVFSGGYYPSVEEKKISTIKEEPIKEIITPEPEEIIEPEPEEIIVPEPEETIEPEPEENFDFQNDNPYGDEYF